jgi:hypothetical protein
MSVADRQPRPGTKEVQDRPELDVSCITGVGLVEPLPDVQANPVAWVTKSKLVPVRSNRMPCATGLQVRPPSKVR